MSFWTNCNQCGSLVYMAKVRPPNEYYSRWLPFEDELLVDCHLENCFSSNYKYIKTTTIKKNKLIKCPICNADVREDRLDKHKSKVHSKNIPTPKNEKHKLIKCPICTSNVREDRLEKHIKKVHT